MLYDLWTDLAGNQSEVVSVENVRLLVQVIVRLIDPKRVVNKGHEGEETNLTEGDR